MFTYVAHFDRKVGIYIATKLFQVTSWKEPSNPSRTAFSGAARAVAFGPRTGIFSTVLQ